VSKSIYSCVIEGDPICTYAPNAQAHLLKARDALKDLAFTLHEISNREDDEAELGYLCGQVDACLKILSSHETLLEQKASRLDEQVKDLLRAIQTFRNCPLLGPATDLRGTHEYTQLCDTWERHAATTYGRTPAGRPNAPTIHIPAGA